MQGIEKVGIIAIRIFGNGAENKPNDGEGKTMILWLVAGYVAAAVAFYSYIVATAGEEPQEQASVVLDMHEWQRSREERTRKAA